MEKISEYAIPVVMLGFAVLIIFSHRDMNNVFVSGAVNGMKTALSLAPNMIILMACISMLNASGAVQVLSAAASPVLEFIGIPSEIVPLILVRPISGSAATALLNDIFKLHGAESFAGRCASVIAGSTDAILYTVSVYFGAIKCKSTRHALPAAFAAQIFAVFVSCTVVRLMFGN